MYSSNTIKKYQGKSLGELPPHVFAIGKRVTLIISFSIELVMNVDEVGTRACGYWHKKTVLAEQGRSRAVDDDQTRT